MVLRFRCCCPVLLALALGCTFATQAQVAGEGSSSRETAAGPPVWPTAYPASPATPLGEKVAALLGKPGVADAHWGIAVTALDGTPIFGLDEAKLFRPASTAKLFTTATAMALLGPEATAETTVSFPAPDASGKVTGNITLVGGNDANLGAHDVPWSGTGDQSTGKDPMADLRSLATQVAAKGVHRITGQVVASSLPWDPYPQGWEIEDELPAFGAPVASLSFADNTVHLTVTAETTPAQPPVVKLVPDLGLYRIISSVGMTDPSTPVQITLSHSPGNRVLRIDGLLPRGKGYAANISMDDPPLFVVTAFRQELLAAGITVDGGVQALHQEHVEVNFLQKAREPLPKIVNPGPGFGSVEDLLVLHQLSPPLQQDVVATLKESLNLHAELLLRRLAQAPGQPTNPGRSPAVEGARVVHQWLLDHGIAEQDFAFYDGSGLSTKDLVTPRAEAQLLAAATQQPWFAQWKAALPVGGVDGTLANQFKGSPLRGHVSAKTGTLGESRALAGYVQCRSGREVIFSILEDNHMPGSTADRETMEALVEAIAATN